MLEKEEFEPKFYKEPPAIKECMLIRDCIDGFFRESQKSSSSLSTWPSIMQANYVHCFENKDNLIWQALKQEANFLEVDLVLSFQKLDLVLGHRCTQWFCRIDSPIGE